MCAHLLLASPHGSFFAGEAAGEAFGEAVAPAEAFGVAVAAVDASAGFGVASDTTIPIAIVIAVSDATNMRLMGGKRFSPSPRPPSAAQGRASRLRESAAE